MNPERDYMEILEVLPPEMTLEEALLKVEDYQRCGMQAKLDIENYAIFVDMPDSP